MRQLQETIDTIAHRADQREVWWAEPAPGEDGVYLVRSDDGVIAEGLTRDQAMSIAGAYNLARSDAKALGRAASKRPRRSA
jgi:hypothetical protein